MWKLINDILRRGKKSATPRSIKVNGVEVDSPQMIAESFLTYFANLPKEFKIKSPMTKLSFHKLKKFINSRLPREKKFHMCDVTKSYVKDQLLALKTGTATGIDNLYARLLCGPCIAHFNGAVVTDMNCHRPISVLPILSKVLERHVFDKLYDFLSAHDLISNHQSAFRKHNSCQSLLVKITDYLLRGMDNGNMNGLTMLDLRKAFDLVDHPTLLCKLNLYGLDDRAVVHFLPHFLPQRKRVSSFYR